MKRGFNSKPLLIISLICIVIAIITIGLIGRSSTSTDTPATDQQTSAPSPPANDSNDTQTAGTDFSALLNEGVSSRQIDGLQYAIYQYAQPAGISVKNVAVKSGSVAHTVSEDDGTGTYTFVLTFDQSKSLRASMQSSGLYTIRLVLFDDSGKQIYDSKDVDASKLN